MATFYSGAYSTGAMMTCTFFKLLFTFWFLFKYLSPVSEHTCKNVSCVLSNIILRVALIWAEQLFLKVCCSSYGSNRTFTAFFIYIWPTGVYCLDFLACVI